VQTHIILFSITGKTRKLAKKLEAALAGSDAAIKFSELEPSGSFKMSQRTVPLNRIPNIEKDQVLVLASPVHGGRISGPMMEFLSHAGSLAGKKVALLATHFFPYKWGCMQMFDQMDALCSEKGGEVIARGSVSQFTWNRNKHMAMVIDRIAGLVKQIQ